MARELTKEQKKALALARARAAAATPGEQTTSEGIIDKFTQGVTANFGDEITALESALLGRRPGGGTFDLFNYGDTTFEQRRQEALAAERAQQAQFTKDNPATAMTAEIAERS